MKERFLRALYRGGCVAPVSGQNWGVWRGQDLRQRSIGQVSDEEVVHLQICGHLRELGLDEQSRLVWSGPQTELGSVVPNADILGECEAQALNGASLLERVVLGVSSKREQERLIRAATDYQSDYEQFYRASSFGGMNWNAIIAGTRVDGGMVGAGERRRDFANTAKQRKEKLRDLLGEIAEAKLKSIIIDRVSRTAFCRQYSMSSTSSEIKGLALLTALADAYDRRVKRPERAVRQSA